MSGDRVAALGAAGAVGLVALALATGPFLRALGLVRANYRGDRIPASYGLLILIWAGPMLVTLAVLAPALRREMAAMATVVGGMGFLGFIDDRWGDRSRSGLRGHFRAFLLEGVVTTGFLKAAGGAAVGVLVARQMLKTSWPDAVLDGAVIALSANAVNLLDLRPGRAGAAFLLLSAVVVTARWTSPAIMPLLFVIIPSLVVFERDSRGRVMMGDSGSNLLGGALGLVAVLTLPGVITRLFMLAGLVGLHVLAERVSLNRVIENNALLRRIDRLTGVR